jgi:hypothetical protein
MTPLNRLLLMTVATIAGLIGLMVLAGPARLPFALLAATPFAVGIVAWTRQRRR